MFIATVVRSCRRCDSASSTIVEVTHSGVVTSTSWSARSIAKLGERAGDAGAEIEQDDLVEGGEERDELSVAVRAEPRRQLGVARCAEDVQPGRQPGDVGRELGGGVEAIGVVEQVGERALRAPSVGRQARERAEVGVGVDGDRPQLEVAREQVAQRRTC